MLFEKRPEDFTLKFSVVSCFCEYDGEILLLKRQKFKPQGDTWGVPAGKVDLDEKPIEALIREVREETNIEVDINQVDFFNTVYVKYTDLDFVYYIFHTKFNKKPEVKIRDKEHSKYIWASPQKALTMDLIEDLNKCIKLF